jgi:Protein of unknown function (DUF1453)
MFPMELGVCANCLSNGNRCDDNKIKNVFEAGFAGALEGSYDPITHRQAVRMNWHQLVPYIGPAIIVILIGRRLMRAQQPRRVRPNLVWIQPAILLAGMVALFATTPVQFSPLALAIFVIGACAGAAVGYFRALHQQFSIEPETGNVMSKATPLGSILFLGIFVVRYAMNYWMKGGQQTDIRHAPSAHVLLYTDAMLFFAFAMVAATAFEVYRRTRPLVVEHRAANAALPGQTPQGE